VERTIDRSVRSEQKEAIATGGDVNYAPRGRVRSADPLRATAGMPSCVAKLATRPIRNREAAVTEP
jgi:hypothetical protein